MNKITAVITGVAGQDGSYLAEYLIEKGYQVIGISRRKSVEPGLANLDDLFPNENFVFLEGDITDATFISRVLHEYHPHEYYNLAAMSHVGQSFREPVATFKVDAEAVVTQLELIRQISPYTRFYQASTSELFGGINCPEGGYNELSTFHPRSPYAVAKMAAYWSVVNYREAYGLYACNGILFNHSSPRRGIDFATRKITRGAARVRYGLQKNISMGDLSAFRDEGHSKDYCVDLDTKILTPFGFKKREELSVGDVIINYSLDNNVWEEDTISKIYDVSYKGDMYIFAGNGFKIRCSENHRIFYRKKTESSKAYRGKWIETTAKEMYNLYYNKSLRYKYQFQFPGFEGIRKKDFKIKDEMIYLIGALLAEGCLSKSKLIGGGTQLSISQSVGKYYNKYKECIDALNLTYTERKREDGVVEFIFNSNSRDLILDYFNNYDIHSMPSICYNFSKRQLDILIEAMMDGDGCWAASSYCSSRYKLANDFKNIVLMSGKKAKISKRSSGVYTVTIFSHAKKSKKVYITDIKKEYSEENIWCIEANKNGTIITEKDDEVFVSGNCKAMHLMLQQPNAEEFVISTGQGATIEDMFCHVADKAGFTLEELYEQNPKFMRPSDVSFLLGDASKAKEKLGWEPEYTWKTLLDEMYEHDIKLCKKELGQI